MRKGRPTADARDVALGARIRAQRLLVGMTQEALGDVLGVSFQQVQKYEKGANRVASNRLIEIAAALATTTSDLLGEEAQAHSVSLFSPRALRVAAAFERLDEPGRAALALLLDRLAPSVAAEPQRAAA